MSSRRFKEKERIRKRKSRISQNFSNEDDINRTPVNQEHENPVVIKATESGSCQEEPTQSLDSFSSIQNKNAANIEVFAVPMYYKIRKTVQRERDDSMERERTPMTNSVTLEKNDQISKRKNTERLNKKKDTLRRKLHREKPDHKAVEKEREKTQRKFIGNNPEYRKAEQKKDTLRWKLHREKPDHKAVEKERETNAKKRKHSEQDFREREKIMNTEYRSEKRRDPAYRANEKQSDTKRRDEQQTSIDHCISNFHRAVEQGPVYTCTSCHQLLYKHSVCKYSGAFSDKDKGKDAVRKLIDICPQTASASEEIWICKTCQSHIKKRENSTIISSK
ncbi:nuclear speckle splicing regulatory protein 1-like [Ostrea edulis]|uniref:nuclear speckle splicing regulatory protein 1-like n=1 Tax=Ostrea edulis TaxID=37623 RepID=UPI0024AF0613|nr:nuclear speckle splicing regulatory protein 1-like [Ostrea edulis]